MKRLLSVLMILLFSIVTLFAQEPKQEAWVQMMLNPNSNFYDVQDAFYSYWKNKTIEKGKGYKQFKRYEEFMKPRVYPTGYLPNEIIVEELSKLVNQKSQNKSAVMAGNWTALGPTTVPVNGLGYQSAGIGRVNCIRFDPQNINNIWVGTPGGGLWKTTNAGTNWSSNTDAFSTLGVSDIAIHPSNSNIMYIATGDADGADTYSIGVLKSIDGGSTWNTTGLSFQTSGQNRIARLLINPTTPDILIAFTNSGVYRTINAGTNWTSVISGNFFDGEFKPGDANIVYAGSYSGSGTGKVYYSTNGGQTFTQATGLPSSNILRTSIAVTAANSSIVYVLASNSTDYGYRALYKSTNSGVSYTQVNSSPNLLGWVVDGTDVGGQGWYDLALAVSPTDANLIYVGGVNLWKSTNGGTTFTNTGHWYGDAGKPFIHADQHILEFQPNSSVIFSGNDGGIRKSTNEGAAWTDLSNGLQITQFYRVSSSATDATIVYGGAQDNGTNRYINGAWRAVLGGDGMQCLVEPTNANNVYAGIQYGDIRRSTNGGLSFTSVKPAGAPDGAWITPYALHPTISSTVFIAYDRIYKSTNSGSSYTMLTANLPTGELHEILKISISSPDVMYAGKGNRLYRTINGGTTWTSIVAGLPTASAYLKDVAISNTDANKIWAVFSGYSSTNKVFYSSNGGTSWTNISTGLPNLPVNCIEYENNSNDAIYIGTDVGVYYKNNSIAWMSYMTNLPNVKVQDLDIQYATQKIRAATYGRGLWESPLYTFVAVPIPNFNIAQSSIFEGQSINFIDASTNSPNSWNWTFTGGTPSTSTSQNPTITYNSAGVYSVKLKVGNSAGFDSLTKIGYVTVSQAGLASCVSWDVQASGFTALSRGINDVSIVNENIAWASAYDGSGGNATVRDYSRTINGGQTWIPGTVNASGITSSYGLANLCAINADTAWAAIYPNTTSIAAQGVYRTNNGGTTWVKQTSATFNLSTSFINVVHFFNANDGVALGDPESGYHEIYTTSNGGTTWARVPQANLPAPLAADEYGTIGYYHVLGNTVWYTTTKGRIYKSTNKGLNWTVTTTPLAANCFIVDLAFKDQNNGIMICNRLSPVENGILYSTSNGGTTWSLLTNNLTAISGENSIAYVPGTTNTYYVSSAVAGSSGTAYTEDGGATWTVLDNIQHNCVRFYNQNTGYSGGFNTSNTVGGMFKLKNQNLTAIITPQGSTTFCFGSDVVLSTDSVPNYTYKWYRNNQLITNAINHKYTATQAGAYIVEIISGTCSVQSAAVNTTVLNSPAIPSIAGANTFCNGDSITISSSSASNYQWYKNNVMIANANSSTLIIKEAGTYTVQVSNANNCTSSSANFVITSFDRPAKALVTNLTPFDLCDGDTANLSIATNANIQWYRNNSIISGASQSNYSATQAGNYHVELSNGSSCKMYSDTINILFNTVPSKPIITQTDSILSTEVAAGYRWYINDTLIPNAIDRTLKIFVSGNYMVEIANSDTTCSNFSDTFFALLSSLNNSINYFNALVKPNPSVGRFILEFDAKDNERVNVELINMLGQVVKAIEINSLINNERNAIEIEHAIPGMYILRMKSNNYRYDQKLIIKAY
jgi:photosystem II stability/assembly factor-like uncharacterized protein